MPPILDSMHHTQFQRSKLSLSSKVSCEIAMCESRKWPTYKNIKDVDVKKTVNFSTTSLF